MSLLPLTYAGNCYFDRTLPLVTGEVRPAGIDLNYLLATDVVSLFLRVRKHADLAASELGISTFMTMVAKGDDRYVGLPVFPTRAFRHGAVYVNAGGGVDNPEDLAGRKVGVTEYYMAAALWVRAFLLHDYGVSPESISWRYGGLHTPRDVVAEQRTPPGVAIEPIGEDETLLGLLERGGLDAVVTAEILDGVAGGESRVRRLFLDHRAVEREYLRRTGFYPVMHTVVVRRDVYEANRWVARSLLEAFVEARRRGRAQLAALGHTALALPGLGAALEEARGQFGDRDPYVYGFEENLPVLEAVTGYSYEQGLTERKLDPAELFAPETLDVAVSS
jgi:4,5-dihydroxyphthalate decarboxylase